MKTPFRRATFAVTAAHTIRKCHLKEYSFISISRKKTARNLVFQKLVELHIEKRSVVF
jgi:hypothetical protein